MTQFAASDDRHCGSVEKGSRGNEVLEALDLRESAYRNDEELAVMHILPATKPARPRVWNRMRDLCTAAGMVLRQKGDAEGALSFNPENREQVKLAIKLAGVKRKRQMSEKQKAVAETALRLALARKRGTAVPTEGALAT